MAETCIVVGAGPGIGQAAALAFAREGYDIALVSRHPERLVAQTTEIVWMSGRRAQAFGADATDAESLRGALRESQIALGPPRVLVYNVASVQRARPGTLDVEQLVREFRANVAGALVCAQALAPDLCVAGGGSLLFTGGGLADHPTADYASLSLCKAALRSLTHTLAQEYGQHGIHVATVTVHGFVQAGTHFDPHLIAQSFIKLHRQPKGRFDIELVYR
jgi:NAD(P)-dependent dehydrogenase (short-subunit alcohol dehydrogenase family)